MRLASFQRNGDARTGLGILLPGPDGDRLVDLRALDPDLPTDCLAALRDWDQVRPAITAAAARAHDAPELTDIRLLSPVPRPGKVVCVGLNYRDHAEEAGVAIPETPTVFAKFSTAVTGPADPIVLPASSTQVDYEGELGVVIGAVTRHVSPAQALGRVAGYLVVNDVSARDHQHRTTQWTAGKSFDTFAPMGPALITADEIDDPQALDLTVRVNGETLQSSNTKQMVFPVAEIVAYLSTIMTLEPGDVIATGTPGGVGAGRTPQRFLRAGDLVEVEIARVGALANPVVAVGSNGGSR